MKTWENFLRKLKCFQQMMYSLPTGSARLIPLILQNSLKGTLPPRLDEGPSLHLPPPLSQWHISGLYLVPGFPAGPLAPFPPPWWCLGPWDTESVSHQRAEWMDESLLLGNKCDVEYLLDTKMVNKLNQRVIEMSRVWSIHIDLILGLLLSDLFWLYTNKLREEESRLLVYLGWILFSLRISENA